jgi:pyrrolysyl-tRNA synthetase-like protein
MKIGFSQVQLMRLKELDALSEGQDISFETVKERDREYQKLEKKLVDARRRELREFQSHHRRPRLCVLKTKLIDTLVGNGFSQVVTPTTMSKSLLAKMSISEDHPLFQKIFWLDGKRCLRPMLAPHLYSVLQDLLRTWHKPIRIFEVGSCFRKETQGAQHSIEFTMLNLVEMGLPVAECESRMKELASLVTHAAGIEEYGLEEEQSVVYGMTMDIVCPIHNDVKTKTSAASREVRSEASQVLELGSAAAGPHVLDRAWGITEPWVGIGFGLERLLMARDKKESIGRWGRSISYLDGMRLNL